MRALATIVVLIGGGLTVAAETAAAGEPQLGPSELVENAARSMLKDLDADRAAYRKDPSKVGALAEFTSDRLKVFPTKVEADAERASVRTEVTRDNGDHVPVNYSLRKSDD